MTAYPKLRTIDARPFEQDGVRYLALRDPEELRVGTLLVPETVAPLLTLLNGRTPITRLTAFATRATVDELLRALDEACLLDNERSQAALRRAENTFHESPQRTPALAGSVYPAAPDALRAALDGYLAAVQGTTSASTNGATGGVGLLSPHIDFARGGETYARAWQQIAPALADTELVVVFATDHGGVDPYTLTRQHYATPFGPLPTAVDVVDALVEIIDEELGEGAALAGELRHRKEHSIELVLVWLHHMLGKAGRSEPPAVVPILCGSFYDYIRNGREPAADALHNSVLETLRAASAGRRTLVVASGDLAHVGPAFGGAPVHQPQRDLLRRTDDVLIETLVAADAGAFFEQIRAVRDRNNVCGTTPVYHALRLLQGLHGEHAIEGIRTGYQQCPADGRNTSTVSICGVVWG